MRFGIFNGVLLLLGLCCSTVRGADEQRVVVTMFALTDEAWRLVSQQHDELHQRLWQHLDTEAKAGRVQRIVSADMKLHAEQTVEWREGREMAYAECWQADEKAKVQPQKISKRFVGTLIKATLDSPQVALVFSHDLSAPVMRPINYAVAAAGAERDKMAVAYPQFDKLEWQGTLALTPWPHRLVASFFQPARHGTDAMPAMRYVLFIQPETP